MFNLFASLFHMDDYDYDYDLPPLPQAIPTLDDLDIVCFGGDTVKAYEGERWIVDYIDADYGTLHTSKVVTIAKVDNRNPYTGKTSNDGLGSWIYLHTLEGATYARESQIEIYGKLEEGKYHAVQNMPYANRSPLAQDRERTINGGLSPLRAA